VTDLQATVQRLLDERDVIDRINGYCAAADAPSPDGLLDCFTEDGLFTYAASDGAERSLVCRGRAELERWFVERLPVVPPGAMMHVTVHPRVTRLEGDRAEATSQFLGIRVRADGLFVASTGHYRDVLERGADGRWRFSERHSIGDMPR
jgi:ketosteroid isomerase-like protein